MSQLLTLFITPVIYIYFEHFRQWVGSRRRAAHPQPAGAPRRLICRFGSVNG